MGGARMGELSSALSSSRKGSAANIGVMNTTATAREARSRNLARLRKLTIGIAALGMAATSGFGFLAAAASTGAAATTATTAYTTAATTSSSSTSSSTTTSAPAVTTSTGSAHVSSGGS